MLTMVPEDISDAVARGDRQAVKAWLNAEDSDVNAFSVYGQSLLGTCVLAAAQSQSKYESLNHLEVGRMLVARGAKAGALGYSHLLRSPLVMPITSLNVAGTDEMYAWYDLLIGAGADPNSSSEVLVDGFRCRMSMLSRVCFFFPVTVLITTVLPRLAPIRSGSDARIAPYSAFGRSYLEAAPHSSGGEVGGERRAAATREQRMPSLFSSSSGTTASSGTSSPSGKKQTKNTYT